MAFTLKFDMPARQWGAAGHYNNSGVAVYRTTVSLSDEGGSAINVLALTVTLFCLIRYPKVTRVCQRPHFGQFIITFISALHISIT